MHFVKSYGIIKKSREKGGFSVDEENDVISMDFPEYEEEYPPFPDVKTEESFAECRDEIYEKNVKLAEKMELAERKNENPVRKKKKRCKKTKRFADAARIILVALPCLFLAAAYFSKIFPEQEQETEYSILTFDDEYFKKNSIMQQCEAVITGDSVQFGDKDEECELTIKFTLRNGGNEYIMLAPLQFCVNLGTGAGVSPYLSDGSQYPSYMPVAPGEVIEFRLKYTMNDEDLRHFKGFYYGQYSGHWFAPDDSVKHGIELAIENLNEN